MGIEAYFSIVFLASLVMVVRDLRDDFLGTPQNPLPSWNAGIWIFLFFLSSVSALYLLFALQSMALTDTWRNNPLLLPWRVPVMALASQLGMLLGLWLTFRVKASTSHSDTLDQPSETFQFSPTKLRYYDALTTGLIGMLAALPLVLLTSYIWSETLTWLFELGFDISLKSQELLDLMSEHSDAGVFLSITFMAVIVAPAVEELVFRGAIYRYLKGLISPRTGMVLSSLLFAAIHFNLLAFLPLFLLGMLLCRAYEKSKNILVPIGMHAFFNANAVLTTIMMPHLEALQQ